MPQVSKQDFDRLYAKVEKVNGELAQVEASVSSLAAICKGIDSKFGMVWKLQLATLTIMAAAIVTGMWFVLQVAMRVIFK
jgi:hypothetical protein